MIISKDFNVIYSIKFDSLLKHILEFSYKINNEFNYIKSSIIQTDI